MAAQLGAPVGPSASQEVFDMVDREADGSDSLAARRFEPCHFAPGQTIVAQAPRGSNLVCGRSLDSLDMTTRGSLCNYSASFTILTGFMNPLPHCVFALGPKSGWRSRDATPFSTCFCLFRSTTKLQVSPPSRNRAEKKHNKYNVEDVT